MLLLVCLVTTITFGCESQPAALVLQPALLIEVNPQIRAELQELVSAAIGGISVTLGPDVLTKDSLLLIERSSRQMRITGREMQRPVKFQLLTDGEKCWLERLPNGALRELQVSCRAARAF
ncbi:hypothetical protein [Microbulbifer sp. 2205BS26-8]|uniref:hypothetical protein n=1 Tax=Microbulbifer sp. 2205BS26-8 TaxID=3064386 RepID=UPI00273D37D4|nr:hypothetical protein [Microbulbifer sp. 2205BS26-8]MDP5209591.1 hypothetical protein [Microbulbifer sp. 2205BS26-8]